MVNRITPPEGYALGDYLSEVVGDFEALRELMHRTADCATPRALDALLRLTRAQLNSIVTALQQDVGNMYMHYDGIILRVELRTCARGKHAKCCQICQPD